MYLCQSGADGQLPSTDDSILEVYSTTIGESRTDRRKTHTTTVMMLTSMTRVLVSKPRLAESLLTIGDGAAGVGES